MVSPLISQTVTTINKDTVICLHLSVSKQIILDLEMREKNSACKSDCKKVGDKVTTFFSILPIHTCLLVRLVSLKACKYEHFLT